MPGELRHSSTRLPGFVMGASLCPEDWPGAEARHGLAQPVREEPQGPGLDADTWVPKCESHYFWYQHKPTVPTFVITLPTLEGKEV